MRSVKRNTKVTVDRRVEPHEGDHRPPRPPAEPALCPGCGAVYVNKHWAHGIDPHAFTTNPDAPVAVRICASCHQRRAGMPHGYVHIDGEYFPAHRVEIESLLHHEIDHARTDGAMNQVLEWEDDGTGGLLITTASELLAQRLGHALEKAYDGEVHYGFSHENKLAHVWWHR